MTPAEPGLREALRAVFADYDEPPTEKYLDEAVHKFRAALAAAPQPAPFYPPTGDTLTGQWDGPRAAAPAEPGLREALLRLRPILEPMTRMDARRDEVLGIIDTALAATPQPALDVERLRQALWHVYDTSGRVNVEQGAAMVAAEYERLGGEG